MYPESTFQEGYSKVIEPDTWKLKFSVTQEMIEDAKFGKIKSKAAGFMMSYNRTRELFSAFFFNNGNSTSATFGKKTFNTTCADGLALFSTAHTSITGGTGTQSNLYGGAINYDNICALEEKMHYFTDDDGNIMNLQPDTIIIPDKAAAKKALFNAIGQDGEPITFNNSFNIQYGRWNVIISPYLNDWSGTSGGNTWYMMDSAWNQAYQGLIWLDRIKLTVNSYIDDGTDANVFKGRARYSAGANNWRCIAACAPNLSGASTL
jgi:phage major head subunit gpT-like protein